MGCAKNENDSKKILIKLDTVFYKTLVSETQSRNVIEIWFHFEKCDFGDLVGEETGVPGEKPPTSEREGPLTLLMTCDPKWGR